ncbi:MAG: DUF4209 domain-containing protein [Phycisphaerae bacterium]|nr:DUF4209 domain-containing protein [Phycisphaerae bacterium]
MDDFDNLQSLYEHLETNALDYEYRGGIELLFRNLRDLFQERNDTDNAKIAQWETDFFNFRLENGEVLPIYEAPNEDGQWLSYPNCKNLDGQAYDYLAERLKVTNNPLLRARYAHILWGSPRRHTKYAKQAVESYLELIPIYEKKDTQAPEKHFGIDAWDAIQNACHLGYKVKYRIDTIKSEIRRLVLHFNYESRFSYGFRGRLIELMLEARRRFAKDDFAGFQDVCWRIANSLIDTSSLNAAIDMLDLGEKVDGRTGLTTHSWVEKRAESYESLMNQRRKGDLAAPDFCLSALRDYKRIGNSAKVKELEAKYDELKRSVEFQQFGGTVDLTETVQKYIKFADTLAEKGSEAIINFLMFNKKVLPKYKDIKKCVDQNDKKFVFQQFAAASIMDQHGHAAQHFSIDEKERHNILQNYAIHIEFDKIHLINAVFFGAIQQNKLSAKILIEYFHKNSWFGKTLRHKSPTQDFVYCWLDLIAPALDDYFSQMNYYLMNPANTPHFVLSTDSLVLKIEGLIRSICECCSVSTVYLTKDSKNRNITREKDIYALMSEEQVQKLIAEDDLLFFKFLLVEKTGYNLRHKVAHALMFFQEYSLEYIHLLILALLRLGRYDFVKQEDKIVGNRKRKVFHKSTCKYVDRLGAKNKVHFDSSTIAIKNGYCPCRICIS